MKLSQEKLLDILERAQAAGCFTEVIKLIRSETPVAMIEVVIRESKARLDSMDWFPDDLFGTD